MTFKIFITQKVWGYIKTAKVELIVLASVLAFDLLTKGIVQATMDYGQQIDIIPNFFSFNFVMNAYAGFGFDFFISNATARRIVFLIFTAISVVAFFIAMYKFRHKHWLARVTFALIIAGALGNMFDRAFMVMPLEAGPNYAGLYGVRDFIRFDFGSRTFPIFNIADMALVGGVGVFAVYFIFIYKPDPPSLVGPIFIENWKGEIEEAEQPIGTDGNPFEFSA